jgi:hypothetical protein
MQDLLPWMAPWGMWAIYALMGLAGVVLSASGWHGWRFHDTPRCPRCGYDRTGLPSETCPECGHVIPRPIDAFRSRRRRWSLMLLGLFVATALPALAVQRRVRQYGWEYYTRVGPAYAASPYEVEWSYDVAGYRIESIRDRRDLYEGSEFQGPVLRIRRGDAVLLRKEHLAWTYIVTTPAPGTDLNANGVPDVILGTNGGGHDHTHWAIIELDRRRPHLLGDFRNPPDVEFSVCDPDGDGVWHVNVPLWSYDEKTGWDCVPSTVAWDGKRFAHRPEF